MKSQIVPVLLFSLAFPWIVARVYQSEGRVVTRMEESQERNRQESLLSGSNKKAASEPVLYEELSTKQINFLIP